VERANPEDHKLRVAKKKKKSHAERKEKKTSRSKGRFGTGSQGETPPREETRGLLENHPKNNFRYWKTGMGERKFSLTTKVAPKNSCRRKRGVQEKFKKGLKRGRPRFGDEGGRYQGGPQKGAGGRKRPKSKKALRKNGEKTWSRERVTKKLKKVKVKRPWEGKGPG